jgi:hypothetical protein
MPVRNIVTAVLLVLAFVAGAIYQKMSTPAQQPALAGAPEGSEGTGMPPAGEASQQSLGGAPAGTSPGLAWSVPPTWKDTGERPMRVATYTVPASGGDSEGGECAVFYFGPGQGGGIDENIDRWVGQFEHASQPRRSTQAVGDIPVKRVELTGDYLAPSGPMMQSTGTRSGWMLLGAIAKGPNGNVFFKLTGPRKTLAAARKEFEGLLVSMRKS